METNSPLIVFISGLFSCIATLGAIYLQRQAQQKRRPKDRIEAALDIYAAIIKDMRAVNEAQSDQLLIAAKENKRLHGVITELQTQLKTSAAQMLALQEQITELRNGKLET